MILSAENITISFTEKKLLNNISIFIDNNDKIGIVGINGTGKSTLLKILSGLETPQSGKVTLANNTIISYVPQHPVFDKDKTVLDYVTENNKAHTWDIQTQAKSLITRFGLNSNDNISQLSGGQKKRVCLVAAIVSPANLLILDEPTNHIDSEMVEYLENYLKNFKGAIVMVTHDRYFLDRVTNSIIEINHGSIYRYNTNYSGFIQLKTEREEMEISTDRKIKSILRNELEWLQRGARARSTKQKARIQRYEQLKSREYFKADEKVDITSVSSRLGKTIIEIDSISKSYGNKKLFDNFSYIFTKGDRVGFIGKNGCGKTTMVKIIAKIEKPDFGTVKIGQTVKIGYYHQELNLIQNLDQTVIDYIRNTAEYVKTPDGTISASQMLEKFLFNSELQYTQIKRLSGGEKRRLSLLKVLMTEPNVLILDEPTNDLDITTMSILEEFIELFDGVVIAVSHDRYFLDRTVNRIFAFENDGRIKQYEGSYSDYLLNKPKEKEAKTKTDTKTSSYKPTHEKKLKFTYKEQKEYETIEFDISALEEKLSEIDSLILKNSTDFEKLTELTKQKEEIEQNLTQKMERWEELEELNNKINAQKN